MSREMLQIKEVELSKLKPWQDNPRLNDEAVDTVARSIQAFGFNVPILCGQDFTIIAGHTRWKAAKKLKLTTAPVITLEMTDAQRRAFSIADNKTTEIADWDFPKLRDVLEKLRTEDCDLQSLGYSAAELQALLVPEEDFDWDAFEFVKSEENHLSYVILRVKVQREKRSAVLSAIKACASERGIIERDTGVAAGTVLVHLLGLA